MGEKIQRQIQKIFGGNAPEDSLAAFGSMNTGNPVYTDNIEDLQTSDYEQGWAAAIAANEAPFLEEMNGVQYGLSKQIAYTLQTGMPEWDANTEYFANTSFCQVNGIWYQSLTDNNIGNNPTEDTTNWKEISFNSGGSGGSGTSLPLFSPVLQDHILSFEESKGYALQGTWVYKESAPERYGYPDFYNTCLKEYQDSEQVIITDADINQPVFTSNTEDGITISDSRGNTTVLRALMNGTNTYNQIGLWSTYWLNIDYNEPTVLKNYTIKADSNGSAEYPNAWTVQGTNDGETFEVIDSQSGIAFTLGQSLTFEISEQNTTYRQYRIVFSDGVLSGGSNGELSKVTFEAKRAYNVFKHSNGHFFYDISDKDLIDKYFASNSIAWFYGVDKENERIFLPRNNKFIQYTTDTSKVNEFNKAGLPNITGDVAGSRDTSKNKSGVFANSTIVSTGHAGHGSTSGYSYSYNFNASLSNSIYGNSDTVQPASVKQLLYIIVGNTEQTQAITDVTEVTTSENDTIPMFTGMYFDFAPNNASWLKAGEQANSGRIYTSCYNTLVNCLTEVNNIYDLKVITTEDMKDGIDYSEYWKINQDEMYFITPTTLSYKALSGRVKGNGSAMVGVKNLTAPAIEEPEFYFGKHTTSDYVSIWNSAQAQNAIGLTPNASKSGIIAEESDVQLYFKVTNAVQNLELLDAGKVLEALADKIGRQDCKSYVIKTYENGASGFRLYSDRYIKQWGQAVATSDGSVEVPLLVEMRDIDYFINSTGYLGLDILNNTSYNVGNAQSWARGTDRFYTYGLVNHPRPWIVEGYVSEEAWNELQNS